ncbi:M48 family peptidase [Rufibacter immobilis]|uniref:M48 family peptidase n=1 Tax=Rufibacter immobilis TaxID=1348778 RepID=A0A3M9MY25_9BACT|nr:SprT family zinc-dependent metalloprotease [Rufibacter immobilis]RNI30065.1 M48 family peptidase [Rufibacter immobilis]
MESKKRAAAPKQGVLEKEIENIGKVQFVPSATAKYVRISIRPGQGVKVTLPKRASLAQAEAFVQEKAAWIRKHLHSQQQEQGKKTVFTPETEFRTRFHQLLLLPHPLPQCKSRLKDGVLYVWYPEQISYEHSDIQDYIVKAIEYTLRLEAKQYLPQRVAQFARQFGFSYQQVTIKNAKTRWGSCSATNNINLNLHLMRLPAHLCDYVILHELAHTVEKNHGPRFWALLDQISGDARGLDKQLKAYRLHIY